MTPAPITSSNELQAEFERIITAFVEHRDKHGGIMIPTKVIVDRAFQRALYATGLEKPPSEVQIIGKK